MDADPYAPPKAHVADVSAAARPAPPPQVAWAVRLCWLSSVLTLPQMFSELSNQPGSGVALPTYVIFTLLVYVPLFAFFFVLYVTMARGYRWARIVYAALILLGLLGAYKSVPQSFTHAVWLGVLHIIVGGLGVATLWLLFTGPANAWFRTRGGRLALP